MHQMFEMRQIVLLIFISSTQGQCKSFSHYHVPDRYLHACAIIVFSTWNGTNITGPVLIYQDEILANDTGISGSDLTVDLDNNGSLVCRAESQTVVGWRTPLDRRVSSDDDNDFKQIRTAAGENPSISRLSLTRAGVSRDDRASNGLWTCRLSGTEELVHVGVYGRGKLHLYLLTRLDSAISC